MTSSNVWGGWGAVPSKEARAVTAAATDAESRNAASSRIDQLRGDSPHQMIERAPAFPRPSRVLSRMARGCVTNARASALRAGRIWTEHAGKNLDHVITENVHPA